MALGDGGGSFRSRAASIFSTQRRDSGAEHKRTGSLRILHRQSEAQWNEKRSVGAGSPGFDGSRTSTSRTRTHHTSGENAVAHDREAQRIVRAIPAWVHTLDEDDEEIQAATQSPVFPTGAHIAHHNPQPAPSFWNSQPQRGRLYDHERESAPPLPRGSVRDTSSRWKAFTSSSMYPRTSTDLDQETVSEEWLTQHGADYSQPWLEGGDEDDVEKGKMSAFKSHIKRRAWYLRLQRTLLRSPVIPLIVRMINFSFSMVALGLAGSIHHLTVNNRYMGSSTSTKMAIIVDAIALVYLLYIAYDEYSAKPLGLRSAKAKMRLLFLDLFFIVFDSANLSLAFEAVGDEGRCGVVCDRQEALASVLLVALIAWLLTFSISVMRVVERVNAR